MTRDTVYERCADTAKRIRAALKAHFPAVKFSVRSKTYSGGASISVRWVDGPGTRDVEAVAQRFEGADFDGMQDLKTYKHALVSQEDGSVQRLHYGSDFVFCNREMSDATKAALMADLTALIGPCDYNGSARVWVDEAGKFWKTDRSDYVSTLLWQAFCRRSPTPTTETHHGD